MPTHASEGTGDDAEEWMPLRMRRARTSSIGSASASGADSSQHNPNASSSAASASASDVDASHHSGTNPPPGGSGSGSGGGGITRTRSRGSSITQAIPLEAALKEEAAKSSKEKQRSGSRQPSRPGTNGGGGGGEGDDNDDNSSLGRASAAASAAASLIERAGSNVSQLLAGAGASPGKKGRGRMQELGGDGEDEDEGERVVGGGLDGNVMRFVRRGSEDVEQGLVASASSPTSGGFGGGSGNPQRKLPSSRGVSFVGHDKDEDDDDDGGPGVMKRSNTFTIGPGLVGKEGSGGSGGSDGGRGGSKFGRKGFPLRNTATLPPPDLSRGTSDTSSTASLGREPGKRLRSRMNSSTFSIQEELHFDLDPDFDCSATHLVKLFAMMDKDGNGILTYDELYESLLSMPGLQSIPREKLDELFEKMDEDGNEGVSQDEFISMFQHIATKALARKGPGNLLEFSVYDYGPDQALCRRIYTKDPDSDDLDKTQVEFSLDEYFEEPIEDVKDGYVRWIAITGLEPSVVVRLANRYRLHPLQVEDVLTYHKQRMKTDKSGHALQLLVGRCVHSEYNGLPQIRKEQVTVFLLENYNTVITIQQTPSDINRRLLARIMYAGSKIRLNGPRFLAYAVVDAIVDEIFPILRQIRKRLKALHSDVTSTNKRTSLASIHLIQHIIREANLLLLWLSPLSTVVSRLSSELLGMVEGLPSTPEGFFVAKGVSDYDLKKHLDDLVDHAAALKEQTASMIDWAKSLNDEYLNEQQYRMNEVIYILTMTTTTMLPAQFLTGVFGMNFTHFPLLDETYGFILFWVFTGLAILAILWFFWLKGWWTM